MPERGDRNLLKIALWQKQFLTCCFLKMKRKEKAKGRLSPRSDKPAGVNKVADTNRNDKAVRLIY